MRVDHLSLTNFRNFVRLETPFPAGALILAGANAQGKTSLLEALYLFTSAASPFADSDRQMINFLALHEAQPVARLRGRNPQSARAATSRSAPVLRDDRRG